MLIAMHDISLEENRFSVEYTVQSSDLNGYKLLHGGRLLTLADEAGYVAASRYCRMDCLTVAVHRAAFHQSAGCGDHLLIIAQLALSGPSSMWVSIDVQNSTGKSIMDAVFVYVAVDTGRHPVHVPRIEATSPAGKALQQKMLHMKSSLREKTSE